MCLVYTDKTWRAQTEKQGQSKQWRRAAGPFSSHLARLRSGSFRAVRFFTVWLVVGRRGAESRRPAARQARGESGGGGLAGAAGLLLTTACRRAGGGQVRGRGGRHARDEGTVVLPLAFFDGDGACQRMHAGRDASQGTCIDPPRPAPLSSHSLHCYLTVWRTWIGVLS